MSGQFVIVVGASTDYADAEIGWAWAGEPGVLLDGSERCETG